MRLPRWIYPLIRHGDNIAIHKKYGVSTSSISSIKLTGSGRKENVEKIIKWYEENYKEYVSNLKK